MSIQDDEPPDEVAALVLKIDADIEIERLRAGMRELRDVVIDHNRSGADWKTPELFGRMMDALAKADTLLAPNAQAQARPEAPKAL